MHEKIKSSLLVLIPIFFHTFQSVGQIEIVPSDVLELLGQTQFMKQRTAVPTNVQVGPAGANKIWDFRLLDVVGGYSYSQSFVSSESTPFAEEFTDANFSIHSVISGSDYYNFYKVAEDALNDIGQGVLYTVQGTPYRELSLGSYLLAPLPLAFGSSWNVVTEDTTDYETLLVVNKDSTFNEVDGWGEIRLPMGDLACLRIKSRSFASEENIFEGQSFLTNDTVISYTWITKDAFIVLSMSSLSNEKDEQFTTAINVSMVASMDQSTAVLEQELNADDWTIYPNPVKDHFSIELDVVHPGRHLVQILDCHSKVLSTVSDRDLEKGFHTLEIGADVLSFSAGFYFIRITSEAASDVKAFIKVTP